MEKENEEDREVIHNKEETRVKGGEMTWNEAEAKGARGLRLLCSSQLGQTLPSPRLFFVAVISFPSSRYTSRRTAAQILIFYQWT